MSDIDALADDLLQAAAAVIAETPDIIGYYAGRTANLARASAPVRTGELRGGISVQVAGSGQSAAIFATAPYAPYVEHGTSKMPPQPFMAPALDQVEPEFIAAVEALGGDVL